MNKNGKIYNLFFYTALVILSIEIIVKPFNEISVFVLAAYPLLLLAAYIQFQSDKIQQTSVFLSHKTNPWDKRKKDLIDHYSQEENIDISFQECLESLYKDSATNNRIKRILNNYKESDKPFKIKLKRPSENRFDTEVFDND